MVVMILNKYVNIINELEIYRAIEEKIEKREEPIRI